MVAKGLKSKTRWPALPRELIKSVSCCKGDAALFCSNGVRTVGGREKSADMTATKKRRSHESSSVERRNLLECLPRTGSYSTGNTVEMVFSSLSLFFLKFELPRRCSCYAERDRMKRTECPTGTLGLLAPAKANDLGRRAAEAGDKAARKATVSADENVFLLSVAAERFVFSFRSAVRQRAVKS